MVSVFSDDRFRGVSVSDGRPVGTLDLSFDAADGLYGSVSGTIVAARGEGLRALSVVFNGGYAKRLRSGVTADVGLVHSRYSRYSALVSGRDYTEAYVGLTGKLLGARISVSPDYFGRARWTVHGEMNGHLNLTRRLVLDGELGLLVPAERPRYQTKSLVQADARLGLAEQVGRVTFHAEVTTGSHQATVYDLRAHQRTALVLGVSAAL